MVWYGAVDCRNVSNRCCSNRYGTLDYGTVDYWLRYGTADYRQSTVRQITGTVRFGVVNYGTVDFRYCTECTSYVPLFQLRKRAYSIAKCFFPKTSLQPGLSLFTKCPPSSSLWPPLTLQLPIVWRDRMTLRAAEPTARALVQALVNLYVGVGSARGGSVYQVREILRCGTGEVSVMVWKRYGIGMVAIR